FLESRLQADPKVLLCGNSLGCISALYLAAENADVVDGLILRNPPALDDVVRHVARQYPGGRWVGPIVNELPESMDAVIQVERVQQAIVFLQSELDSLVLPEFQTKIQDGHPGPQKVEVLVGIDHHELTDDRHEQGIESCLRWLIEQVSDRHRTFHQPREG
ncbi:MAG: alpha/beta hydrolase, partial [Planctomycetota bacterium]